MEKLIKLNIKNELIQCNSDDDYELQTFPTPTLIDPEKNKL